MSTPSYTDPLDPDDELTNRDRALVNRPGPQRDTDDLDASETMRRTDDAPMSQPARDAEQPSQNDEALIGWLENADTGRDKRLAMAAAVETDLATRLADMHSRMDAVDAKIASIGTPTRDKAPAVEQVETLRERLDALSNDPDLSRVSKPDHRTITTAPTSNVRL